MAGGEVYTPGARNRRFPRLPKKSGHPSQIDPIHTAGKLHNAAPMQQTTRVIPRLRLAVVGTIVAVCIV
jgi:hypothetical protein